MTKAKQNKNNNKRKLQQPPRQGSVVPVRNQRTNFGVAFYSRVTDPIVNSVYSNPLVMSSVTTNASGDASTHISLSPQGVTAWNTTTSAKVQVESPQLPWLYNASRNFARYRILRANVILVSNVGTTSPGNISIKSTSDYSDAGVEIAQTLTGGNEFSLASIASRNKSVALQVDTAWKKVTSETTRLLSTGLVSLNTVNDLAFSNISLRVAGGPVSTIVANMYIEYDVEFANPVAVAYNG